MPRLWLVLEAKTPRMSASGFFFLEISMLTCQVSIPRTKNELFDRAILGQGITRLKVLPYEKTLTHQIVRRAFGHNEFLIISSKFQKL